jgi:phosphoribosylaminoimidazole synthetase
MRRRGTPYVGVLYAGLMLTEQGPRVLEFNCRFGDPETQVLLPLLETDLVDIIFTCLEGGLDQIRIDWKPEHTVCIVQASDGYPGSYDVGKEITGVERVNDLADVVVFQAGTKLEDERLLTAGGRVLAVTANGPDLASARRRAYGAAAQISFSGAHYRRDIAAGAETESHSPDANKSESRSAYARSGVDIDRGNRAVALMRQAVRNTYTAGVLDGIGTFGGMFALGRAVRRTEEVVLVASTDGVGTKTMIAAAMERFDTVGHDIVNHCMNDILVQGARPLFFLDYVAAAQLEPEHIATIVAGCAQACENLRCALLGGETAEMPGVYRPDSFDLVGTMVGWVHKDAIIDGSQVRAGDICLGLPSSGLHTNGYSLVRHLFSKRGWDAVLPELGRPLGEVLLTPHRAYLKEAEILWDAGLAIRGMAHITGGGLLENIPRVLPPDVAVQVDRAAWEVPPIFRIIQTQGQVDEMEMYRVFNMGIGLVLLVEPTTVDLVLETLGNEVVMLGRVVNWDGHAPRVQL